MTFFKRVLPVCQIGKHTAVIAFALAAAGCSSIGTPSPDNRSSGNLWAPGVDTGQQAEDGLVVGHRLMQAGEYELALDAFTGAAATHGLTPEVLSSLGSANLGLGRLGQAENLLRQASEEAPSWPEPLNNLGIVLLERGKTAEAVQIFKKAYALDNGESDAIRDNLRLALEKFENSSHSDEQSTENDTYKLVRQGGGSYAIRRSP